MENDLSHIDPDSAAHGLEAELVAYLDGELDVAEARRIEQLLSTDADARRKLQGLQWSWDLLGELDRAAVDPRFTQTTLEMVAVAAGSEVEQSQALLPRRRRRRWLLAVGGTLAAGLAGFFLAAALWPNPNKRLLQDLPVVENLDQYRQVGDIEFLRTLASTHMFDEDRVPAKIDEP